MKIFAKITALALTVAMIFTLAACGEEKKDENKLSDSIDFSKSVTAIISVENYGDISIELDHSAAPITVENFVDLAGDGFYDGLTL